MNAQEKLYRWKMSYTRSRRRSRRRRGARGIRRDPAVHTRFGCVCPGRTTLAAHLFLYSSSYILIFFSYLFLKCCFKSGLWWIQRTHRLVYSMEHRQVNKTHTHKKKKKTIYFILFSEFCCLFDSRRILWFSLTDAPKKPKIRDSFFSSISIHPYSDIFLFFQSILS
jgi:hypothetical protein